MLCDWAEQVSLLCDGELPRAEAAAVEAHLEGCLDCRAARAEFLSYRRQLNSYRFEVAPDAQHRALEKVLARGPASRVVPALVGEARPTAGRREKVLAAFGLAAFRPAAVAALALVVASAVGLAVYFSARDGARGVVQTPAPASNNPQAAGGPAPGGVEKTADDRTAAHVETGGPRRPGEGNVGGEPRAVEAGPAPAKAKTKQHQPTRGRSVLASRTNAAHVRPPGVVQPPALPAVAAGDAEPAAAATDAVRRELPRAGLDTARHVEQAQMLLRSFRNARPSDDLSYERERSRRLLYRNIVLRREAASHGDPLVASVLGRLEPILIDIANLPDSPAPGDVDPIRERVRKKNLVVVLQAGRENAQVGSRQ